MFFLKIPEFLPEVFIIKDQKNIDLILFYFYFILFYLFIYLFIHSLLFCLFVSFVVVVVLCLFSLLFSRRLNVFLEN